MSPDGQRIAYVVTADFIPSGSCSDTFVHTAIWVVNTDGTGATLIDAGTNDPDGPSWLTNSRLLLNDAASTLYFVDLPGTKATPWVAQGGMFPDQKAGRLATDGYDSSGPVLRLWSSSGPPAAPAGKCDYVGPAGGADGRFGEISWAPDGRALVWEEGDDVADEIGEGTWIMPVGDINTTCPPPTDSQVFIPGGFRPSWGPASVNPPPLPTLAVNDVRVTEGNSGTTTATFTVTRSGDLSRTSSVSWTTADGTATAPSDYAAGNGTANFGVGDPAEQVTVPVTGDTIDEMDETFSLGLLSPVGATITDGTGVGTIADDDPPVALPTLAVNDVSVTEGNSGTKLATFTITRSGATTGTSKVSWATADYTAKAPTDYLAKAPTEVTFNPGVPSVQVSVTVNGDAIAEANERFYLNLSAPVDATIANGTGLGTITNDDTSFAVNDVTVTEGNSGTTTATFTITRSGIVTGTSKVSWATADSTAKAPTDYLARALTEVTFDPNVRTLQVQVAVNGDTTAEANERFFVKLSSPVSATILDGTGMGTITNDDTGLAVNDVTLIEGNSGTRKATFTITRSRVLTGTSKVSWATADSTAKAPGDYKAQALTEVTFDAGVPTVQVDVDVNGETAVEPDERFYVNLSSPSGATILDGTGVGTITNDDSAELPTLAINDVSLVEGNSGTRAAIFTITRSGSTTGTSTVSWGTVNGTATAPEDYVAQAPSPVTFGTEPTIQVSVPVNGDTTLEPDETFFVKLSSPSGATIVDDTGVGTIANDDPGPQTFQYNIGTTVSDGQPGPGAGNLEKPGAEDRYTFTVSNGDTLFVDGLGSTNCALEWNITRADGSPLVANRALCGWDPGKIFFAAGTYTLVVHPPVNSEHIGTYGFRITESPDPQAFPYTLGTAVSNGQPWAGAGNIEMPGAEDVYSFTTTIDYQMITISGISSSDCQGTYLKLTGPSGHVFTSIGCGGGWVGGLDRAGTYQIAIGAAPTTQVDATFSYSFTTASLTETFDYTIGTTVSNGQPLAGAGNVERFGASDRYTFTATANQKVFVDWISASDCNRLRWTMTGPDGTTIFGPRGCGDPGFLTLPTTATYTVVFDTPYGGGPTPTASGSCPVRWRSPTCGS